MNIDLSRSVAAVKPGVFQEFLRSRGWTLKEDRSNQYGIAVYEREGVVLDVPLHQDYADYARRMVEVLIPLAEIEQVSPLALLDDLARPAGDVLAVCVQSELAAAGTIPLIDSLRFREGTKNLLLAAAHSTIHPSPYFPRMSRSEAIELLAAVHEGQSLRGSFVARFIVPVEPVVGTQPLEDPFGRRVTKRLMCALESVRRVRALGAYDDLLSMHTDGVSGNLLAALALMRPPGGAGTLELSMAWARNRNVPVGIASSVRLPDEALVGLESVAEAMRSKVQARGFEVSGYVSKLERRPGEADAPGDVVIVPISGDAADMKSVFVHLDAESYNEAIWAHESGSLVRVVGTLGKDGRRWTLNQASGFEIVPGEESDPPDRGSGEGAS